MPRVPPRSSLLDQVWEVPGLSEVRVVQPTAALLAEVDATWPLTRRQTDVHDWKWQGIAVKAQETLAVIDEERRAVALWASFKRLRRLESGKAYVLDRLEVAPRCRGATAGLFTLGLIASRALERGAEQLVLAAIPQARLLYDRAGGEQRLAKGWSVAQGLLAYAFPQETLFLLEETIDAFRKSDQAT